MIGKAYFAEIEYDESIKAMSETHSQIQSQPIGRRSDDPIRQRFYDMRSLAPNNSNDWNSPKLFYNQGKFMADFEDDYPRRLDLSMYSPCYQRMGYEDLRAYFTWRTDIRNGNFPPTCPAYIFLHVYELLSYIGVKSPEDGLEQLMTLWNKYRTHVSVLNNYMHNWLWDYHIYYELPHTFDEFIKMYDLKNYYTMVTLFNLTDSDVFSAWAKLSIYNPKKSLFWQRSEENAEHMQHSFIVVLNALQEFFREKGGDLKDLVAYTANAIAQRNWKPFEKALFHPWLEQEDREITMPDGSIYICKKNNWNVQPLVFSPHIKHIIGFLIKKTESCVRQYVKFRKNITADIKAIEDTHASYLVKLNIKPSELESTIESAVSQYFKDLTRVNITVDVQNIKRIREEAQNTQEKLIVPEAVSKVVSEAEAVVAINAPSPIVTPPSITPIPPNADETNIWMQFSESLTSTERDALKIILSGSDIYAFAQQNNLMPETLFDSINEKSMDIIGDGLIDLSDGVSIYNDYRDELMNQIF